MSTLRNTENSAFGMWHYGLVSIVCGTKMRSPRNMIEEKKLCVLPIDQFWRSFSDSCMTFFEKWKVTSVYDFFWKVKSVHSIDFVKTYNPAQKCLNEIMLCLEIQQIWTHTQSIKTNGMPISIKAYHTIAEQRHPFSNFANGWWFHKIGTNHTNIHTPFPAMLFPP